MLPACPPHSRNRPAFAWQLAAAPPRRAGPHPAPLSSGVYCVVAFCPSLTGNTTSHTSHTSLKNPQNPHPVCCGIACFEPRFASWREISQHTPSGGHLPMFAHTRRRFKSSVLRYLDFRPGLRPDLRDIAAQYSTHQPNQPPPPPHQRFKNAALSEPTPNTPVVCCVLLKKGGDWRQTPRYRSTHSERARGKVNPGEARSGQAEQERTRPRAGAGPNGPNGMGVGGLVGEGRL